MMNMQKKTRLTVEDDAKNMSKSSTNKSKLLIVNDNMNIGGIQKSLLNLLNSVYQKYDVTLLLLNPNGSYMKDIPEEVRVVSANKLLMVFGASKDELKQKPLLYIWKGICKIVLRVISKDKFLKFIFIFQKKIKGYNQAISFTHPATDGNLRSCSAEFVLNVVQAPQKICFLHCDYSADTMHDIYTDRMLYKFQKIACCSESVRTQLIKQLPDLDDRAYTVRNFYDLTIENKKNDFEVDFELNYINVLSVARLSKEKGIERAVNVIGKLDRLDLRYYIIGDGPQRKILEKLIIEYKATDRIILLGEMDNPYPFISKADYLLVPSFHEAAPMVFDEANIIGTAVISTNTLSAKEMISGGSSIVCANSEHGLWDVLSIVSKPEYRKQKSADNKMQLQQFVSLLKN